MESTGKDDWEALITDYRLRYKREIYRVRPWMDDNPARHFRLCGERVVAEMAKEATRDVGEQFGDWVNWYLGRYLDDNQRHLELDGFKSSVA